MPHSPHSLERLPNDLRDVPQQLRVYARVLDLNEVKRLAKPEEIEMRIVASGARRDLGELDAAVITLTCKELKTENEEWAVRLRYAYADALHTAGRKEEATEWFGKCAAIDHEELTDAAERAQL